MSVAEQKQHFLFTQGSGVNSFWLCKIGIPYKKIKKNEEANKGSGATLRNKQIRNRKFIECYIINLALSLLMKHLVIGQRQKAPNFSAFHWSPHGSLVSIGQHFVTTRVVYLPKRIETSLITESDQNEINRQLLQQCTARTAWSESDQDVRAVHSCISWFLIVSGNFMLCGIVKAKHKNAARTNVPQMCKNKCVCESP